MAQHIVNAPDGSRHIINAPDDATPEQVISYAQKNISGTNRSDQNFFQRAGEDIKKRTGQVASIWDANDRSMPEKWFQGNLKIAQLPFDFGTEALVSGFRALPNAIEDPVRKGASDVYTYLANSPAGDLAHNAVQGYGNFKEKHPRAAANAEALADAGNIAAAFTPIKGTSAVGAVEKSAKTLARPAVQYADTALPRTIRPTANQLKASSQANYKIVAEKGANLSPKITDTLIEKAESFGPMDAMVAATKKPTIVNDLAKSWQDFKGQPMTLDRAVALDRHLTDLLDSPTATDKIGILSSEGREVIQVRQHLRDALDKAADEGLVKGGAEGINAYKAAVKDWAAQRQISEIQRIVDRASYMDNPATALKTGFRNIASNPERLGKFPKNVQPAIKQAARDGNLVNILRTEIGSRLISSMVGTAAGSAAGPIGAVIGGAAGFAGSRVARNTAEAMQMGRVNNVVDAIAANSSLPSVKIPRSALSAKQIAKLPPAEAIEYLNSVKIGREKPISKEQVALKDPARLLAPPGKLSPIPMSEQEITISQAKVQRGKRNPIQESGASTKPPVSQFTKLADNLGRERGRDFQNTVQIFKDGDMSQNQFIKDATEKFGLTTTQARSLAKEIKTYMQD